MRRVMEGAGPQSAMIFAAGLGTRMGALTRDRPKPLIEVGGRPLIDYSLDLAREAGVPKLVVNTHAHADQMRAHLALAAPEAFISFEPERLETGGGLKRALPLLGSGAVFTLNADMVWSGENPLATLREGWDAARMDALLCLVPRAIAQGHHGSGDFFLGADGRLTRRGNEPQAPYVYTGAQILETAALGGFGAGVFSLNPVWDALIARGRLYGVVHTGGWVDVGRPEGIPLAEAEAAR